MQSAKLTAALARESRLKRRRTPPSQSLAQNPGFETAFAIASIL
jgi:hypothetical protein